MGWELEETREQRPDKASGRFQEAVAAAPGAMAGQGRREIDDYGLTNFDF
jgi:hypothetical protein